MRAKSFQYRPLIQSAALPAPTATSELVPAINSEDPCGFYPLASSRRSSSPVHDPSIQIGWILRTVFLESLKFRASVIVDSSNQMISTCSRVFSTTGSFSTRRAEIETAMAEHGLGRTGDRPHLAARATLMTRAHKRDVDRGELRRDWERQASDLGFSPETVRAKAMQAERPAPDLFAGPGYAAGDAARWAVAHLSEREVVFGHSDLLAATLGREPGAVTVEAAEKAIAGLERDGGLHAARGLDHGRHWTTDAALARESETIALMRAGQGTEKTIMRGWIAETKLRKGQLNEGQKGAVKAILSAKDLVIGVKGYAGTGKTTML